MGTGYTVLQLQHFCVAEIQPKVIAVTAVLQQKLPPYYGITATIFPHYRGITLTYFKTVPITTVIRDITAVTIPHATLKETINR